MVNRLTKMVCYELVKIIIDAPGLVEVIIKAIIQLYGLPDSIISNKDSVFISKF